MKNQLHRRASLVALVAASALALTACATTTPAAESTDETTAGSGSGRVALTYDGGIVVLDSESLELAADIPVEGFNRLNAAGDGQNVFVTTTEGFQVLRAAGEPELTDLVFPATTAGHVVKHGDKTILFADGTGDSTIFDTAALLDSTTELPETETVASEAAHHGVAIELEDGTFLSTLGTSEGRSGVRALDSSRTEVLRSEDCPSVHGEGAAMNEIAVFGCSDGVLVYDDGAFTKITAPDAYGRTGNQYTSETSSITVGDYNADPDAEGVLLSQLVLTNTVAKTMQVVDMPEGVGYTWRDVVRGPEDEAYVLGSDGAVYELDVTTGEFTELVSVIDAWEGPVEWQDAHPALSILENTLYVTDPAADSVHAVDLATGAVVASAELPGAPIEIAVVPGK
ncbi:zinc metallochaperone AztD [Conyzicola sp.]|uniref:zinc metallochaperone AztD n=1 Tax=Conyzicola sp. TaxID=1969404 RepID=UPI0039899CD4